MPEGHSAIVGSASNPASRSVPQHPRQDCVRAPCRASFPLYSDLQKELGDQGLTILAVSVDKQPEQYAEFVKKFAPAFATVRDGAQKMVATVHVPGMPTCYLIDRKGVLRVIHRGFHGEASVKELREEISKLLEEKP